MTGPQPSASQKAAALDKAVRLFVGMLTACREMPQHRRRTYVAEVEAAIVEQYRRILIEDLIAGAEYEKHRL
jgi:hypothetical protein